ncbi:hypothetical protein SNOG_04183 [Parastagonospora nodorum SN15]|uniref:nitrilase n=1 Tax=Phaeosphaeria nodorum (strain SN15 / ATCC MYA-4574 / FGSC 10173) TaxID=321614 RepID=Q0UVN1_PHANO|nr:hypothetical protein SNOG_04183 [Parastagonospora nodorum SN15]EAT87943.1 hypothetical protein SNOG_04183 [Parastagonospora nodorum SN15]
MAQSWWHFQSAGYPATLLGSGQSVNHEIAVKIRIMLKSRNQGTPSRLRALNGIYQELLKVLGFSENDHDSLYIAQAIISAEGKPEVLHRKLKATHMERTIFGDASGSSLDNVVHLPEVGRVGALACWEHAQPLLKYHTYHQNETIHVAAWPPVYEHDGGPDLWSMSSKAMISEEGISKLRTSSGGTMNYPGGGSSAVFGPDGRLLAEGPVGTEEGFVYADLQPDDILKAKGFLDVCGHYSRPDMLWLGVDKKEKTHKFIPEVTFVPICEKGFYRRQNTEHGRSA